MSDLKCNRADGLEKFKRLAQLTVYLFIAECTLGSSGRWLEVGTLSIRMILFAITFLATLPFVFQKIRKLARNPQVIVTVIYGVYLLVCAGIGLRRGNNVSFIWSDLTTMMTLALVPGFLAVLSEKEAINRAIDVIYWCAVVLAVLTVAMHLSFSVISEDVFNTIYDFITGRHLGGIAAMQTGMHRVYMRGQVFLQVAIVYGVWKVGVTSGKKRIWLHIANGLLLSGCILSYTRGFWMGLAASAVLLLFMGVKHWGRFLSSAVKMVAVFLVFLALSSICYRGPVVLVEVVNRFNPDLIVWNVSDDQTLTTPSKKPSSSNDKTDKNDKNDSEISENDQDAVDMREMTLQLARKRIKIHPYIGNGLGENLDEIRSEGRIEYMYIDQVVKTGYLGAALFFLTFFGFVAVQIYDGIKRRRAGITEQGWEAPAMRNRFLTAAYLGVAVTSYFNPFLNNPMGITMLLVTSTAVYSARGKEEKEV